MGEISGGSPTHARRARCERGLTARAGSRYIQCASRQQLTRTDFFMSSRSLMLIYAQRLLWLRTVRVVQLACN